MMAGRNRGSNYLLNDHQSSRTSCPQTWKFAVAILLVCALFLMGVVIGYMVAQAPLGRRLDGSCAPTPQQSRSKTTSEDSVEMFTDPRLMKIRHWNLVDYLKTTDYSLPSDFL